MKASLLSTLSNARQYTLQVAEAMPEKHFHVSPETDIRTFAELLHHIGYGISWSEENYILQQQADWNPPAAPVGKAAVIAYLGLSFDMLKATLESVQLTEEVIAGFYATIDHVTHHRGQATIYLRRQGIVPPEYVY
ncbi:DinB family protein [Chitinophaga solisilvae]|uniref:DinB family protein n=1 Tax=Chitinophaga solisilvae TaxID=1233460 RepID=UPI00136A1255|nr:DinB family protein [Chitinophaga solisilvae]